MSIGLDIGSKTIKVVELTRSGDKHILKSAAAVAYSGTSLENMTGEKEMAGLADIIKKLFREAKITEKEVMIALPEYRVFTRSIRFPLLTDQEIASAVKWEAEQYIPISSKDAIVQHQILEKREDSTPPEVIVLLVAVPKALSEKYVKFLSMAGLIAVGIETELIALSRAIAPVDQTALLVDLGARSCDLAITKNGSLAFTRTIPNAGDTLTRSVAKSLNVGLQQAEEYKKTYGLVMDKLEGKVKMALDPVMTVLVDEIKKSIHFYQYEEKGEFPNSLIISGGTAGLPDIVSYLSREVGIEVVVANPFVHLSAEPELLKTISPYAPLYAIATGLAMREL